MAKASNFHKESKPIAVKAKIAWINCGNVELEMSEPQDEESVYRQFLREKGPSIHHVMFATPNHDNCAERMAANDIAVLGSGELQHTRLQMFDTEKSLGLNCEKAESGPLLPDDSV